MPTAARKNHLAFAASAILAAAVICHAQPAPAQAVVPPQTESFPLTYGEWGARWWQYVFGIPEGENPVTDDSTGALCHVGQWGAVFFLVGTSAPGPVSRTCTVPAESGLFFPIINAACAIPEDGNTREKISKGCKDFIDLVDVKSLSVTIDRKSVQNLSKFRASEFFSFTGAVPGEGAGFCDPPVFPHCYEGFHDTAFADGYWVMLRPLSPGNHTVRFQGAIPSFSFAVDVTYNLTVVPQ